MQVQAKHLRVPLYKNYFTLIAASNWADVTKKFSNITRPPTWDEEIFAGTHEFSKKVDGHDRYGVAIIFNPEYRDYENRLALTPAVMAHEAIHAKNFIFRSIGAVNCFIHDEPEAYLVMWIMEEMAKFIDDVELANMKTRGKVTKQTKDGKSNNQKPRVR